MLEKYQKAMTHNNDLDKIRKTVREYTPSPISLPLKLRKTEEALGMVPMKSKGYKGPSYSEFLEVQIRRWPVEHH